MPAPPARLLLMDRAGFRVLMATRTVAQAEAIIAERSNGRALAWTTDDLEALEGIVREADLVVSMIPPSLHIPVAEACLRNEIGEDPGIDHMGAKRMIDEAAKKGGRTDSILGRLRDLSAEYGTELTIADQRAVLEVRPGR